MVCTACRQTNHLRIRRVLAETPLPPVLVINAGVRTSDELDIWVDGRQGAGKRFMQPRFSVGRNGDNVVVKGLEGGETTEGAVTYELRVSAPLHDGREQRLLVPCLVQAMVVQIQSDGDPPHLVALARGRPWSQRFQDPLG